MGKLITANSWFAGYKGTVGKEITHDLFRRAVLKRLFDRFHIPEAGFDQEAKPLQAIVNKGSWLVVCPKCGGAEYAWEEGWFFCCSCKNSYLGHKFRRAVFPEEREKIEDILALRPLANRNWTPGETFEDLERENEEHAAELLAKPVETPVAMPVDDIVIEGGGKGATNVVDNSNN